jgi:YrbI family 3-deoxy-D-manno-octulosonate 8-phosphate phosphatase
MKNKTQVLSDPSLEEQIRKIRLVAFDFDGVFTDNKVYVFEDGSEAVRCTRADGIGLQKLIKYNIETVIISSEKNPCVSMRSKKLGIKIIQKLGISLNQVAFVGNDINDLPCLTCVGLPIIVQDAHRDVISCAKYRTKSRGGHGAVREICDLFDRVISSGHNRSSV